MNTHEIDYRIIGEEMQCVEIELDPQETVIAEAGSLMMMDQDIQMQTIFGDGSKGEQSFMGKVFSAGKRVLTGESLFMTAYSNAGREKKHLLRRWVRGCRFRWMNLRCLFCLENRHDCLRCGAVNKRRHVGRCARLIRLLGIGRR